MNTILGDLNNSLAFNISRVSLLLRKELIHALADYALTPEQWQVLHILSEQEEPINQKAIAEALYKDKHTLSRTVGRMEKSGWLKKETASYDKRVTLLSLTEKGREAKEEMQTILSDHVKKRLFDHFTEEEKEGVKAFLLKSRKILSEFD